MGKNYMDAIFDTDHLQSGLGFFLFAFLESLTNLQTAFIFISIGVAKLNRF